MAYRTAPSAPRVMQLRPNWGGSLFAFVFLGSLFALIGLSAFMSSFKPQNEDPSYYRVVGIVFGGIGFLSVFFPLRALAKVVRITVDANDVIIEWRRRSSTLKTERVRRDEVID